MTNRTAWSNACGNGYNWIRVAPATTTGCCDVGPARCIATCVVTLDSLNLTCTDGEPAPTGTCVDEEQAHQACMQRQ